MRLVYMHKIESIRFALLALLTLCSVLTFYLVSEQGWNNVLIAPISFFLLYTLSRNILTSLAKLDFITWYIMVMMLLRYVLYPTLFSVFIPSVVYDSYMNEAILLYLAEEIVTILALNYYLGRYSSTLDSSTLSAEKTNYGLILFFVLGAIMVLVLFPTVRFNYQFVFNTSIDTMEGMDFSSIIESIGYVVVDIARLFAPLVLINVCYKKSKRSRNQSFYIFLSFLSCIIPMLIIKQMNRGSSFFTSLIYLWIVIKLYGWRKSSSYVFISILTVFALLAVVSSVKHNSEIESQGIGLEYAYDVSQSYSLGLTQIRNGLITNERNKNVSKVEVAFNDICCSLPILNRFGDPNKRYSNLYNNIVYEGLSYNTGSALAPLLTNMIFILGPLGLVFPILFLKFSLIAFFRSFKEKSINTRFLYIYLALVLEAGRTGCLSATVATLVWMILPMYFVAKFTNR